MSKFILCLIAASVIGAGTAHADPASSVSGGEVRDGNKVDAPQDVMPDGGCRFWEKSHAGSNGQAQQNFHIGLGSMIAKCGG